MNCCYKCSCLCNDAINRIMTKAWRAAFQLVVQDSWRLCAVSFRDSLSGTEPTFARNHKFLSWNGMSLMKTDFADTQTPKVNTQWGGKALLSPKHAMNFDAISHWSRPSSARIRTAVASSTEHATLFLPVVTKDFCFRISTPSDTGRGASRSGGRT